MICSLISLRPRRDSVSFIQWTGHRDLKAKTKTKLSRSQALASLRHPCWSKGPLHTTPPLIPTPHHHQHTHSLLPLQRALPFTPQGLAVGCLEEHQGPPSWLTKIRIRMFLSFAVQESSPGLQNTVTALEKWVSAAKLSSFKLKEDCISFLRDAKKEKGANASSEFTYVYDQHMEELFAADGMC